MGVRYPSVASTTFVGPLPASAVETVVLVTPPLTPPLDLAQIFLHWMCSVLAGTSVTSHVWRIRRGTTAAGTLIGAAVWTETIAAGETDVSGGCYVDSPGAVAGQQYALTLVQTAATVAGTFNDGCLLVYSL